MLGSMDGHRWHSASLGVKVNANAENAQSGGSAATISGPILWFAARIVQSSRDPIVVDEGLSDGRAGPIHPQGADIEVFHFL